MYLLDTGYADVSDARCHGNGDATHVCVRCSLVAANRRFVDVRVLSIAGRAPSYSCRCRVPRPASVVDGLRSFRLLDARAPTSSSSLCRRSACRWIERTNEWTTTLRRRVLSLASREPSVGTWRSEQFPLADGSRHCASLHSDILVERIALLWRRPLPHLPCPYSLWAFYIHIDPETFNVISVRCITLDWAESDGWSTSRFIFRPSGAGSLCVTELRWRSVSARTPNTHYRSANVTKQ